MATKTRRGSSVRTIAPLVPLAIALLHGGLPSAATSESGGVLGSCTLPFDALRRNHAIDNSCSASGTASTAAQSAQNEAKNNFCATGKPVDLSFSSFADLQQATENARITFGGNSQLPANRDALHNLLLIPSRGTVGEGSVVRLSAYVMDAHFSNVGKGESVNCQQPGNENNDIHILLSQTPIPPGQKPTAAEECGSVTAEISPHFRPDVWNPENLNRNNAHIFRFTGQLFFDAAHRPCVGGTGANPKRISIWEIHPVYSVEICGDSNNACSVESDQNWVPLSDFVGTPAPANETRFVPRESLFGYLAPPA